MQFIFAEQTNEYEEYKEHHNLDRYFAKDMDYDHCKKILADMKELQVETNWFSINKEIVNAQSSADVTKTLNIIVTEYEVYLKHKIESLMQQTLHE